MMVIAILRPPIFKNYKSIIDIRLMYVRIKCIDFYTFIHIDKKIIWCEGMILDEW